MKALIPLYKLGDLRWFLVARLDRDSDWRKPDDGFRCILQPVTISSQIYVRSQQLLCVRAEACQKDEADARCAPNCTNIQNNIPAETLA